jgi:transposase-like protein
MIAYNSDIKARVQNLVSTGLSVAEAARNVGIRRETVRQWVKQATTATAPARNLLAEKLADDGELSRLRRENNLLRQLVATLLTENA